MGLVERRDRKIRESESRTEKNIPICLSLPVSSFYVYLTGGWSGGLVCPNLLRFSASNLNRCDRVTVDTVFGPSGHRAWRVAWTPLRRN